MTEPTDSDLARQYLGTTGYGETEAASLTPGLWDHAAMATTKGLAAGGVELAHAAHLAGAVPVLAAQGVHNLWTAQDSTALSDRYFSEGDKLYRPAADYFTPDPTTTGQAGQILHGFAQMAAPLLAGGGNPALLIGTAGFGAASRDVDAGVGAGTAVAHGLIDATTTGVGFKLPFLGKNLFSRVATGVAGSVALTDSAALASHALLEAGGYHAQAQNYDPLDPTANWLAAAQGALFGSMAHLSTPATRDAVNTVSDAEHFEQGTMPGQPLTDAAVAQHAANSVSAMEALLNGEPVNVPHPIDMADYRVRPDLLPAPAVEGYGAFRDHLESNGNDQAFNAASGAAGRHQFLASTFANLVEKYKPAWAEGLTPEQVAEQRFNGAHSSEMIAHLDSENAAYLTRHGVPVDNVSLYAAHHFGPAKAVSFATMPGDTPVANLFSTKVLDANPYLRKAKTRDGVIANWQARAHSAGHYTPAELDAPNFALPEAPITLGEDHPLWQAIPEGANGRETYNIQGPEREALRQQLVDEHFTSGPRELAPGEKPIVYLMGGGGASGKGTILRALREQGVIPKAGEAVHIDPDAIKTGENGLSGIPEYAAIHAAGDSRAAAVVHEESSAIAKRTLAQAMAGKHDIVYDRTMGNSAKGLEDIRALKAAGYEVRLFGVTLEPRLAAERSVQRAKGSGRYVPMKDLLTAHRGFANAFGDYAKAADKAALYDNGNAPGEAATLVASHDGGKLVIHDGQRYNQLAKRGSLNVEAKTLRSIHPEPATAAAPGDPPRGDGAGDRVAPGRGSAPGPGVRQGPPPLDPAAFPVQGDAGQVVTERGLVIPVRWAVVEASSLVTSHDDALHVEPRFPAELQPRDRTRAASEVQIARMANAINPDLLGASPKAADGAPIVGADRVVESGNARTIALRRAYAADKAADYQAWLGDHAADFGLDPAQLADVRQPVLVRVAQGHDRIEFARQANETGTARLSATEQAQVDAQRLPDLAGLVPNEDGTLNRHGSADFIRQFLATVPTTEQGNLLLPEGGLSQEGLARIRNAVFARAYGDADLVGMLTESLDANVKNLLSGLLRVAAPMAKLREQIAQGTSYPIDNAPALVAAVRKFAQLRSEGTTVAQYFAQGDMFGSDMTADARNLLRAVDTHARAPKQFAAFLQASIDAVEALGDPRQADLLGGKPVDAASLLARAAAETEAAHAPKPTADMFGARQGPRPDAGPTITDANRAAYEAIAANPDMLIVDETGATVPAAQFLAAAEADAAEAGRAAQAVEAIVGCALRNAA